MDGTEYTSCTDIGTGGVANNEKTVRTGLKKTCESALGGGGGRLSGEREKGERNRSIDRSISTGQSQGEGQTVHTG
jgi:hypothetical protein